MSNLDVTYIQCMTRCESLQKRDCVSIHAVQDGDVNDLV